MFALDMPTLNEDILHQFKDLHRINFSVLNLSVCFSTKGLKCPQASDAGKLDVTQARERAIKTQLEHSFIT